MNTKEAIEFLEKLIELYLPCLKGTINKIINLLKRGEKYEQIWREFKKKNGDEVFDSRSCKSGMLWKNLECVMNIFEQKYLKNERGNHEN